MSGYAYQWAKRQHVGDSAAKTLLKTYAHWAAEDYTTWVTNDELVLDTELDVKTIRKAREKLVSLGFLTETPRRMGGTKSIVVYQMLAPSGSVVVQAVDQRTGDAISLSPPSVEEFDAKPLHKRSPSKFGTAKGDQKRSPSKCGAPPNPDVSPSTFPSKPLHISLEGVPNVEGKKGLEEKEKNLDKQPARRASRVALHEQIRNLELPDEITSEVWAMWCEHREAKHKDAPWTRTAAALSVKRLLSLAAGGQLPEVTVEEAVLRGWTGLFPVKAETGASSPPGGARTIVADWWRTSSGIEARGEQLGVKQGDGETFMRFKARVFKAAGPGEWMEDMLRTVRRESEEHYEALYAYFNDIPRDRHGNTEAA
ncbi:hypothetical protein [Caballeronia sp. LZ001]|uniref:hypothetical protein n=1 Tax=Caballeronia sp. LZ001 TaxID=3038553 RepID=UPI0028619588|nr:hypothetical protein [Caballeronia sp. LZ001]MDR5800592.1 hypothetical protein [Caballeronia sp. LZ001]